MRCLTILILSLFLMAIGPVFSQNKPEPKDKKETTPPPKVLKKKEKKSEPVTPALKKKPVESDPLATIHKEKEERIEVEGKIKQLQSEVGEIKDKVFKAKARLLMLKEKILHGSLSGASSVIFHRNEMGSSFKLIQVRYSLDGVVIYSKYDPAGGLDKTEQFEVFNGLIIPGNHTISVYQVYKGYGYGIFKYFEKYTFKVQSSHTFYAEEGKTTEVRIISYEKGPATGEIKPNIRYEVKLVRKKESIFKK